MQLQKTFACFEPSLDYVVVKIPKWPFDKFQNADRELGTKMMATGEIMAIGSNFEAALLKGIRSLEIGAYSLDYEKFKNSSLEDLKNIIIYADDERIFALAEMLRRGYRVEKLSEITGIDKFFIYKLKWIIDQEEKLKNSTIDDLDKDWLRMLK